MNKSIIWSNKFIIDNGKIDEQHKAIISTINGIHYDLKNDNLASSIVFLYNLVKEHFAYEEYLMSSKNYIMYEDHKLNHDLLLKKFKSHIDDLNSNVADVNKIKRFLIYFVQRHFLGYDRKLALFLRTDS